MTGRRTNERLTHDRNDWQALSQAYTIVIRQLQNANEVLRAENARLTTVIEPKQETT